MMTTTTMMMMVMLVMLVVLMQLEAVKRCRACCQQMGPNAVVFVAMKFVDDDDEYTLCSVQKELLIFICRKQTSRCKLVKLCSFAWF